MKAVIQRVCDANVKVNGEITGSIARGLLIYLGVSASDTEKDADWLTEKIINLRIFNDAQGRMNHSILELIAAAGTDALDAAASETLPGVLLISQFTLLADARKGRRPYYGEAAPPEKANFLYNYLRQKIIEQGLICEAGVFQSIMDVTYTNQGPVTIILDSKDIYTP